MAIILTSTIVN